MQYRPQIKGVDRDNDERCRDAGGRVGVVDLVVGDHQAAGFVGGTDGRPAAVVGEDVFGDLVAGGGGRQGAEADGRLAQEVVAGDLVAAVGGGPRRLADGAVVDDGVADGLVGLAVGDGDAVEEQVGEQVVAGLELMPLISVKLACMPMAPAVGLPRMVRWSLVTVTAAPPGVGVEPGSIWTMSPDWATPRAAARVDAG